MWKGRAGGDTIGAHLNGSSQVWSLMVPLSACFTIAMKLLPGKENLFLFSLKAI